MREALKLTLTAAPANLPLSLNELKLQLRLEDAQSDEDALLLGLLRSAVEACELFTGRALITQSWTVFFDDWPGEHGLPLHEGYREGAVQEDPPTAVALPKPPLQSVTHVKTYDDNDLATTWPAGNYFVDTAGEPGRIVPRVGQSLPTATRAANAIEIQFVAGYGDDPGDVPEAIRQGLLMLSAHLYENRGDGMDKAAKESGVARLWRPYRVLRL